MRFQAKVIQCEQDDKGFENSHMFETVEGTTVATTVIWVGGSTSRKLNTEQHGFYIYRKHVTSIH